MNNEQQNFWKNQYAKDYIDKNSEFNSAVGVKAWSQMLSQTKNIHSILECGCNVGRNIKFLNYVLPEASKSIIELSPDAYNIVTNNFTFNNSFNGSIVESNFQSESIDLVFSMGVLIHIHPDDLLENMKKMFDYSTRYILIGEYFNRTPVMIEYQGEMNKLFKRDFGKYFLDNFFVKIVDYGFLWGYEYDVAGFDDITYWLFEKVEK